MTFFICNFFVVHFVGIKRNRKGEQTKEVWGGEHIIEETSLSCLNDNNKARDNCINVLKVTLLCFFDLISVFGTSFFKPVSIHTMLFNYKQNQSM